MPEAIALHCGTGCSPAVQPVCAGRASLVVITPCCRPELLRYVYDSVRFSIVTRWIIVFDADQVPRENVPAALLHDPHITLAATHVDNSRYGNAQRHLGLQIARTLYFEDDPFIYFLDDDNIVHPAFYDLFQQVMWRRGVFYTFNQRRAGLTCYGKGCVRVMMDTAMICLPLSFCPEWKPSSVYAEDYHFIKSVVRKYGDRHMYVNQVAAHYNALQPRALTRLLGSQQRGHITMVCLAVFIMLAVAMKMIFNVR